MGSSLVPARELSPRELSPYVRRILAVWRASTDDHRADGLVWYPSAHDLARELTPQDVECGAGILAALSPQNAWASNVKAARQTIRTGTAAGTHTHCQTDKADAILAGERPLDVLRGRKERAFFRAIADPDCDAVVIDRHAHDIAVGRPLGDDVDGTRGLRAGGRYANLERAYRRAAVIAGVHANVLQATTWLAWRELHAPAIALTDANIYAQAV